jgi:glycosyltransferase involved in cell wall biosynthesis
MTIAVVLPALNEAAILTRTLESIRNQSRPPDRLLVVDGGSADDSAAVAKRSGAEVMVTPDSGRGGQIAAGVANFCEQIIVVAHADMTFPPAAFGTIRDFLTRHPGSPGGCLGHRFDSPKRVFRAIEWWDRRRAMRGHSYGDQAQFFRREMLGRAGGFPDLPLMEDVELARRLRRLGRPVYLDLPVTVSARRYERLGWPRIMLLNWRLRREYERSGAEACWRLFRRYYASACAR